MNSTATGFGGVSGSTWDFVFQLATLVVAAAALIPQIPGWIRGVRKRVRLEVDFGHGGAETIVEGGATQTLRVRIRNLSGFPIVAHRVWVSIPAAAAQIGGVTVDHEPLHTTALRRSSVTVLGADSQPEVTDSFEADLPTGFLDKDVGVMVLEIVTPPNSPIRSHEFSLTVMVTTTPPQRVPKYHKLQVSSSWFGSPGTEPTRPVSSRTPSAGVGDTELATVNEAQPPTEER